MSNRARRAVRIALLAACAALVVHVAWRVAMPRYLAARLHAELVAQGFTDARLRVTRAGLGGVSIEDVVIGPGLTAERVEIDVGLATLLAGRIDTVTLVGVRWHVVPGRPALPRRPRAGDADGGPVEIPVARIRIVDARIVLGADERAEPIPVDGDVFPHDGGATFALRSELGGRHFVANGTVRPDGEALRTRLVVRGGLDRELHGHRLTVDDGLLRATATLEEGRFTVLHLRADAMAASLGGAGLGRIALEAIQKGDRLDLHTHVSGDAWPAARLAASVPADASAWSGPLALPVEGEIAGPLPVAPIEEALPGLRFERTPHLAASGHGVLHLVDGDMRLELHDAAAKADVGAASLDEKLAVRGLRAQARARGAMGPDGFRLDLSALDARLDAVAIGRGDSPVRVRGARLRGDARVAVEAGVPFVAAPLRVSATSASHAGAEIAARGLDLSLPLEWTEGARVAGRLRARQLAWRGVELCAPSATLALDAEAMILRVRCPYGGPAPARLSVDIRHAGGGTVRISVPRSTIRPGETLAGVLSQITELQVAGPASAEVRLDVDSLARSRARIELFGARVASPDGSPSARGVRGVLSLRSLDPLVGAAPRVRFRDGVLADVEFGRGEARLVLDGSDEIRVEDLRVAVWDGEIRAAPFRVDPEHPDVALDLDVRGLSLARLLETVTDDRATGTGALDGRIAFRVEGGDSPRIDLGEGLLAARSDGRVQVRDSELRDSLRGKLGYEKLVEQRIAGALADFHYTRFVLALRDTNGISKLRAHVRGKGKMVPQELELNLNVSGVQQLVDQALRLVSPGGIRVTTRMEN